MYCPTFSLNVFKRHAVPHIGIFLQNFDITSHSTSNKSLDVIRRRSSWCLGENYEKGNWDEVACQESEVDIVIIIVIIILVFINIIIIEVACQEWEVVWPKYSSTHPSFSMAGIIVVLIIIIITSKSSWSSSWCDQIIPPPTHFLPSSSSSFASSSSWKQRKQDTLLSQKITSQGKCFWNDIFDMNVGKFLSQNHQREIVENWISIAATNSRSCYESTFLVKLLKGNGLENLSILNPAMTARHFINHSYIWVELRGKTQWDICAARIWQIWFGLLL